MSVDPDGDAVSYAWDFDSDGTTHADTRTATHVYTSSGTHTARQTVRDARGLASRDTVVVAVDDALPVATIEAATDETLFRHGAPVPLRGSARDAVDGELTGTSLRWRIVLHHGDHIHLAATDLPSAVQSFTPPGDHDADSFYEVELTATDSAGLRDTQTVVIRPETIALTLASSPPGALLSYSARSYVAPTTLTAAIGYRTSVSAPDAVTIGGASYRFDSWSDGGARSHQFVIPAADRTLTARYRATTGAPAVPAGSAAAVLGSSAFGPAFVRPRPRLRLNPSRPSRARPRRPPERHRGEAARSGRASHDALARALPILVGRQGAAQLAHHAPLRRGFRVDAGARTGASAWRWRVRLRGAPRPGR